MGIKKKNSCQCPFNIHIIAKINLQIGKDNLKIQAEKLSAIHTIFIDMPPPPVCSDTLNIKLFLMELKKLVC
jgi:hypothetical protein